VKSVISRILVECIQRFVDWRCSTSGSGEVRPNFWTILTTLGLANVRLRMVEFMTRAKIVFVLRLFLWPGVTKAVEKNPVLSYIDRARK
jgi:hypothetical protein